MTSQPLPDGIVEVVETLAGAYQQDVRAGRHVLTADEPANVGGDDAGPGPYDYLLAALGACTSMTVRMYANRKGIKLRRVAVRLSHRKVHAQDCADCETKAGDIEEISRVIRFEGDLDETTRAKLLEIANKCPVHRTLTGEIKVRTTLDPVGAAA
ncbi:MAG: OsmC family protein [Rhodospirillaceae bacterium]|nr:OsmC family protein [Rhodospirillaceae bacterium]